MINKNQNEQFKNIEYSNSNFNIEKLEKVPIADEIDILKPKYGLEQLPILSTNEEFTLQNDKNIENNYIKDTFNKNKIINIIILIFLPIIFITEKLYRDSLNTYSTKHIQNMQNSMSQFLLTFFRIITRVGCNYFIISTILIIFFYFSLIHLVIFLIEILLSIYFLSILKIFYGDTRPFLENSTFFQKICEGGYGNPSGHSFVSFVTYLTLLHYILNTKYVKNRNNLKYLLIFVFVFAASTVAYSRIIVGAHSINQVIFGSLLGIWMFLITTYVFKLEKMPIKVYKKYFKEKKYIAFITIIFIIFTIIAIMSNIFFNSQEKINELSKKLDNKCSHKKIFRRFNYDGLFGCLSIVELFGIYLGQIIFWFLEDKIYKSDDDYYEIDEIINNWNKNIISYPSMNNIIKLIFVSLMLIIPFSLYKFIGVNNSIAIIFIFKLGASFIIACFLCFGPILYMMIETFTGDKGGFNNNIYDRKNLRIENI